MKNDQKVLEKKLENIKKQLTTNAILVIIAALVLIFVPMMTFENFMFKFSLEVIIAFVVLIVCVVRSFTLRSKKEELEAELSIYSKKEIKQEVKKVEKEPEQEYTCAWCDKKFKTEETLHKHNETCEKKKHGEEKDIKIVLWGVGIIVFVIFSSISYFVFNNKVNLIAAVLIGFIATPFFDKVFVHYKKRNSRLRHFEFNWWKKTIVIFVIILIFILINLLIPECPKSCNDNNSCTNDFCSAETGYKCMNTLKLNCKGNGICEGGEYGSSDCPNCDDNNKCTVDSYDSASKQCIHTEMIGCVK